MSKIVNGIVAAVLVILLLVIPTFAFLVRTFAEEAGMNRSVFTLLTLLAIVGVVTLLRRVLRARGG